MPLLGLHPYKISDEWAMFLGFPGTIFLRGLQLLIVPIIFASLIAGVSSNKSLPHPQNGRARAFQVPPP